MSLAERQDMMTDNAVWDGGMGSVGDYIALLKPRVMSLVIFTAFVGMMLAPGTLHPVIAGVALLCIAVGAGASGALNMWYDADIDSVMTRTSKRPIPDGKVTPEEALAFGMTLSIGSVLILGLLVNWFAGAFLAFTIFFYAVIYTMWLKRSTPQNIVIGGAAGAFPPMIGWASVTGTVSLESFVLFLIIFMWTPPHFWALALFKKGDYETAGVPMLPVVSGETSTRHQILVYSILLAPIGISPYLLGYASPFYGIASAGLGAAFVWLSFDVWRLREGDAARRATLRLFKYSIYFLFLLFALLFVESIAGRILG
ncbi:protoheme IX farnesyltransferase [Roseibium hamelinense]|uniref:Protoheme IX farnesyltransferase n=1 Tax=Roseibium hamelinense TaxID=150831 RepID=A0A562T3L6_9HYPH|nr:heme o synthase [Roseibium hamelinense]MTI42947.1 protoheme IX farnesyltransferase [Roseibium hamelinense]TWI87616.1 protoheme IX farnesyltransferase [Roseibium hamelinense]